MPDLYEALSDQPFKARCKIAFQSSAVDVMAEPPATEYHSQRVKLCAKIFDGSLPRAEMTCGIITNPTIALAYIDDTPIPDNDLKFAADSLFNTFALSLCPVDP